MAKDVIVKIDLQKAAGKAGFGIPLILATLQNNDVGYTECSDVEEVRKLFPDTTVDVPAALADEWKAATNWTTYADYIVGV